MLHRDRPVAALMDAAALEAVGVELWETFARNNQTARLITGWAYRIGQADRRDVRDTDDTFETVS